MTENTKPSDNIGAFFETAVDHLLSHRRFHLFWLLMVTALAILLVSGLRIGDRQIIKGLQVDNSMEVWFRADDPDWVNYKRFQEYFEGDEFIMVSFRAEDIFQSEILYKIKDLTTKFNKLPYVSQVVSLTNVEDFRGEAGVLEIKELFKKIPKDPGELRQIKARVIQHPIYRGNVISDDGRTTAIVARILTQPPGVNYQREITEAVYELCDQENEGGKYDFQIIGTPILLALEEKASMEDAMLEYALCSIFLVFFLYLLHRRLIFVIIPLTVITVANIWIHGVMPLFGATYNMITNIIAMVVMVIGIADAIHFTAEYQAQIRKEDNPHRAVNKAFRMIILPCLFTSLTTAAGFMSMAISQLKPIKDFAIFVGIAMLMTFVVNMVLVTIWLSYLKKPSHKRDSLHEEGLLHRAMTWVAALNRRHIKINIAIAVTVFFVSFTGIMQIEINTHEIKYFRENHPLRVATEFIEKHLSGTLPLEIMLSGPADTFKEPDILKRLDQLQQFINAEEAAQKTFSMVDYLKEANRVLNDEEEAFYRLPDTRNAVSQLLLLTEGNEKNELENYVDFTDFSVARLHIRFNYIDTNKMKELITVIEEKIAGLFNSTGVTVEVAGSLPMYIHMVDYILDSQIQGFSLALVVIFIMLSILVRSFKLGLLAMVPSVIPIALTCGIMGWFHIDLDIVTVLIPSIAIGLAVDDTIHFIARFRFYFERTRNYDTALDKTIMTAGMPITITSVVLFFGFGIMLVSTFKPIAYFGLLAAITMLSAMIADLFVLPALIKVFKPFGAEQALPI